MDSAEPPHVPVLPPPRFFFAVSLGTLIFFAVWSWLVLGGTAIKAYDLDCAIFWHDWSEAHRGTWGLMVFLTDLGGIAAMALVAVMGAIWQNAIRHRRLAIAWLVVVVGGALLNQGCKGLFERPRPPEDIQNRAVLESNHSYPSGHSMGSAIGYGLLAYALILPQRRRPRRVGVLILLTCIVLAVGFSRIFLRAHWFSDVVGGWTIGIAWLFFCLGWLERQRVKSEPRT
jgi:membrane-associated phospholipid phosphatase